MKIILLSLFLMFAPSAFANQCFEVTKVNPLSLEKSGPLIKEIWCYETVNHGSKNYRFIYNKDRELREEMSFLVELGNKNQAVSVTHGSLLKGEISFVKTSFSDFNPLPIALNPQKDFKKIKVLKDNKKQRHLSILKSLLRESKKAETDGLYTVEEGSFKEFLSEEKKPFRGYWWPHQEGQLLKGENSATEFYDRIIPKLYTQWQPESVAWEKKHHTLQNVEWGGHCNGWAASSVLHKEPTQYLWNPYSQSVVYPSTIKGLLAENSFCVDWAFYGKRYRNGSNGDIKDIYPDKFHKVLLYYIKKLKKPVAIDYKTDDWVDNHVISGYEFNIQKIADGQFQVNARLQAHDYDHRLSERTGVATTYTRVYDYYLYTDRAGNITRGEWITQNNPDFLWVPLSQKDCGRENPHIKSYAIDKILNTLPIAKDIVEEDIFEFDQVIEANQTIEIPLPQHTGSRIRLSYESQTADGYMSLYARGNSYYHSQEQTFHMSVYGNGVVDFINYGIHTAKVLQLRLNLPPEQTSVRKHFKIKRIEYKGQ